MGWQQWALGAALAACGAGWTVHAADAPAAFANALNNTNRPPLEITRDGVLKSAAVLAFAGVKPGMKIAELMPDGGYYTRILSGATGPRGRVYALVPRNGEAAPPVKDPSLNIPLSPIERAYIIEDEPGFKNVDVYWQALDARGGTFALPEQIDMVFTAYDYHVFKGPRFAKMDMAGFDKVMFRGMKNGGVVVIVDNVANPGTDFSSGAALARIDPEAVKAEMTAAGFTFDGESKVLARAGDDHMTSAPDATLPGTVPADAFMLRFRKPANAPNTDLRPKDYAKAIGGVFGNTLISNPGTVEVGDGPREHRHFMHADGTYQEIGKADSRSNVFASGTWFFNADGWNCRRHLYQPRDRDAADCAGVPHAYEHKPGDTWSEPRGGYELRKGYVYFDQ